MEDTKDGDVPILSHTVCDPIVAVEKDSNVLFGSSMESVTAFRKLGQGFRFLDDSLDRPQCRCGIVASYEVVDLPKPVLGFKSPPYLTHDATLAFISS